MAKNKYVVEPKNKLMSFTGWTLAIIAAVVVAVGSLAMLGTTKNVDKKVGATGDQITHSNELNLATKDGLKPSVAMNEQATQVGNTIKGILNTMVGTKEALSSILETTKTNNGVLADLDVNTGEVVTALNGLVPYINALADSVSNSNMDTAASLDLLTQINAVNDQIGAQMAEIDTKLSNSLTYRILFSYLLPILPI